MDYVEADGFIVFMTFTIFELVKLHSCLNHFHKDMLVSQFNF